MPPVLIRGEAIETPMVTRRSGKKTRRRFDIALGMPGAEVRLPSVPMIRPGWRAVSGILTALLSLSLYYLWSSPTYQISGLQVSGLQRLSIEEIDSVLGLTGKAIFELNLDEAHTALAENFPELSQIALSAGLPAQVVIEVVERQPVLAWVQDDRTMWVDEQGIAFPPRGEAEPPIRVRAEASPAHKPGEQLAENQLLTVEMVSAILALKQVAPEERPLLYTREHGLGWEEKRGMQVYMGDELSQLDVKLSLYQAIMERLKEEKIKPALVSVEHIHAPFFRLEP
jgi:cell division protein FtsQ